MNHLFFEVRFESGYHQISMEKTNVFKVAFCIHDSHYDFLLMPFGSINAPTIFQRCMNVHRIIMGLFVRLL